MNWAKKFVRLFRKEKLNREMDDEMRFHLEMQAKENVAAGMASDEAHYAAVRSFGGLDQTKETCRRQRTTVWVEDFFKDLRYGARMLRKNPGFTTVTVLTLAIGIGANTTIFSGADAILFRPLPFPESDRLVAITEIDPQLRITPVSVGDFFEIRGQVHAFRSLAFMAHTVSSTLTGASEPMTVSVQQISANYFATLGVRPAIGRDFLPNEDERGQAAVVILSHGFWLRQFGGRFEVLNQTIELDGRPVTIVGVMREDLSYENIDGGVDMWNPLVLDPQNHGARYFNVVAGRLKSGVTIAQARSEISVVTDRLAKQFPDTNKGYGMRVESLLEDYVGNMRASIFAMFGAVGFLLLICCVNIANLLLARALARQKETVIRATLGAGRGRIVRQFLTESLLLAVLGGGLSILIAEWSNKLLVEFAQPGPRLNGIAINGRAFAFTGTLTLLTGLAFGLVPAFQVTRIDLNDALKSGARGSTKGRQRVRGILVVLEIALALMLLVGAGLFIRSLTELQRVNPGFTTQHVTVVNVALPRKKYLTPVQMTTFVNQAIAQLSALPEVQAVGATQFAPLSGGNTQAFTLVGWSNTDPTKLPDAVATNVTPGYGRALGIPLLRGRFFSERDVSGAPNVVLINEAMARRYFANTDPIGQRIGIMNGGSQPNHWDEVVGIVGNIKVFGIQDDENQAELYELFAQRPSRAMTFVLRPSGNVPALPAAIRGAIYSVDKGQPVASIEPLADVVAQSFSSMNFAVFFFSVFSGVGLGLAAIGIYGVMAYFVTQRTNEIGIRMALGAQRGDMLLLVFSQAARLVGIGLLVGLAGALVLTKFIQSMLFGIKAHDPVTFVAVAGLLAVVALAACLIPALRATRIDPIVALRYE